MHKSRLNPSYSFLKEYQREVFDLILKKSIFIDTDQLSEMVNLVSSEIDEILSDSGSSDLYEVFYHRTQYYVTLLNSECYYEIAELLLDRLSS